ncbi:hypothetical protein [Pseudoalteromonas piscicida]|uniref:hypothetical protein n=1 Tax=Pseudoalteromonas piscicida TaxID=43662 RepID=UPI0027E56F30|nr:hypothetical protein [Pseudoalteromonas piscicida]WMO15485.1 hypothetical protein NI376_07830 [Pseudoalteromonas piscicida]
MQIGLRTFIFSFALITPAAHSKPQVESPAPTKEERIFNSGHITSVDQMTPNHAKVTYKLAKQLIANPNISKTEELIRLSEKVSLTEKKIAEESIKICKDLIDYDISDTRAAVYAFFSKFECLEKFKSRMYIEALRDESEAILNMVESSHHKEFVILTPEVILDDSPTSWLLDHKNLCSSKIISMKQNLTTH